MLNTSDIKSDYKSKKIRILITLLSFLPAHWSLNCLALKHATDKLEHGYIKYYHGYFGPIRKKRLKILEIGIGGSIRMWQTYFPNSMIYGIDIEDKGFYGDKRIKIFKGDQHDPNFLKSVVEKIGKINIVIDDGSHVSQHIITSFHTLFPHLVDDGIYVIEDLETSYLPKYGGSWKNLYDSNTTMTMLKNLLDGLNYEYIPNRSPTYLDKSILSIHFYPKIVFIFKGKNRHVLSKYEEQALEEAIIKK